MSLWNRSSRSRSDDWTPIAGNTPEEVAANFAATVNTAGMSEADLLQAMREDAAFWSDDPQEQMARLLTLKQSFGL
jgi:hypothetical protein